MKTLRGAFVTDRLPDVERPVIYLITHEDGFDYGEHWRWERGELAYTDAGLERIAERLAAFHLHAASQIVRDVRQGWLDGLARVPQRWDVRAEEASA